MTHMTKEKENAAIISQEEIAHGIYSMWIRTKAAETAEPGQFISMYTNDGSKLLPRPISICEIDKEKGALRVVYRVTGENTGTELFSQMGEGDTIPVIGPLGNGFPLEKALEKRAFLIGGGIGVPPILELAKQIGCEKKQIIVGYRNDETFLKTEFEQNGEVYISTEDGSAGTKGNVMDAIVTFVFIRFPPPLTKIPDRLYRFFCYAHYCDDLFLSSCIHMQDMLRYRMPCALPAKYSIRSRFPPHSF